VRHFRRELDSLQHTQGIIIIINNVYPHNYVCMCILSINICNGLTMADVYHNV
jgi:hypothetical protein